MRGFIDLHCHWIADIDDGARSVEDGIAMLRGLHAIGFDRVIATPHMRPSMFDNDRAALEGAYERMKGNLPADLPPQVGLASEHFFDDIVFRRLMMGEGLPYPGGKAVLVEFPTDHFPTQVQARFFDLRMRRLRPVLAHPERYQPVWKDIHVLDPLVDGGTILLLDIAALAGKYGRAPRKCAEKLLEEGYYEAACSDAHKPSDIDEVARGIELLEKAYGKDESRALLQEGPQGVLDGTL